MEGSELDSQPSEQIDFCDKLDKLCEYFMAMGVSYEEFWFGDYCKLKYYEQAYFHQLEKRNYDVWLQGALFYKALEVALARGFGGDKSVKYPTYEEFIGKSKMEEMTQEELWAFIQKQLEDEAKLYAQNHRSE